MKKMLTTLVVILTITSLLIPIGSSYAECIKNDNNPNPEETIELKKQIYQEGNLVNEITKENGSILRFHIKIIYHDTDGDGIGYKIKNIRITDFLPEGLKYLNNASRDPTEILENGSKIIWKLDEIHLYDNKSYFLEFDTKIIKTGVFKNHVNVTAIETCYGEKRYKNTSATIISIQAEHDFVTKDVDYDLNFEKAIDYNDNYSDGYEKYEDEDNSSYVLKQIDGDYDGKIDYFIDPGIDGKIIIKYWDPDDDILKNVEIIDVDYDDTFEWVYDSDNDGEKDKYYDVDDQKIHDYIVHKLNILIDGVGEYELDPDGIYFLDGFEVEIRAIENDNSWIFSHYEGDLKGNVNPDTITMDKEKTIILVFKNNSNDVEVKIIRPMENKFYWNNIEIPFINLKQTKVIGWVKIKADATSKNEIEKVEFYVDNKLKHTDKDSEYSYNWYLKPIDLKNNYTIKVVAYDNFGNINSDTINLTRTRFPAFFKLQIISLIIKIIKDRMDDYNNYDIIKKIIKWFVIVGISGIGINSLLKTFKTDDNNPSDQDSDDSKRHKDNNNPPVADSGGTYEAILGKPVFFDGSESYDPDYDSITYSWDLDDGNYENKKTFEYVYDKPGEYTVKLTVEDEHGKKDTDITKVNVIEQKGLISDRSEDDLYWYIVTSLGVGLTSLLSVLFFRRRYFV